MIEDDDQLEIFESAMIAVVGLFAIVNLFTNFKNDKAEFKIRKNDQVSMPI